MVDYHDRRYRRRYAGLLRYLACAPSAAWHSLMRPVDHFGARAWTPWGQPNHAIYCAPTVYHETRFIVASRYACEWRGLEHKLRAAMNSLRVPVHNLWFENTRGPLEVHMVTDQRDNGRFEHTIGHILAAELSSAHVHGVHIQTYRF